MFLSLMCVSVCCSAFTQPADSRICVCACIPCDQDLIKYKFSFARPNKD